MQRRASALERFPTGCLLSIGQLLSQLCKRANIRKSRVRALRPLDPDDISLLQAVNHGEFVVSEFRNRDIAEILYGPPPSSSKQRRTRTAKVLRLH